MRSSGANQQQDFEEKEEQISMNQLQTALDRQSDPEQVKALADKFKKVFYKAQDQQLYECFQIIVIFIMKGYGSEFAFQLKILRKLITQFIRLSYNSFQHQNYQAKNRMIYVLSLIAQLIKEVPRLKFPFTKKFIDKLFLIDREFIQNNTDHSKNILAILSVIYENLSTQHSLIKHLKISYQIKVALLEKYDIIQELFSVKHFNRGLYNLAKSGQQLTQGDIHKYNLESTLSKFVEKNNMVIFMKKLQSTLFQNQLRCKIKKREEQSKQQPMVEQI